MPDAGSWISGGDLHVVRLDLAAGTLAGRIGNGEPVRLSVSLDEGFILVYIL